MCKRIRTSQKAATQRQAITLTSICQQTIVANLHETIGENVLQETFDKLVSWNGCCFAAVAISPIAIAEGHLPILTS